MKVAAQSQHADFIRSPFIRSLSFLLNFTPRLKHVYGYSLLPQTICYPWILLNSWVFNGSLADVFFFVSFTTKATLIHGYHFDERIVRMVKLVNN